MATPYALNVETEKVHEGSTPSLRMCVLFPDGVVVTREVLALESVVRIHLRERNRCLKGPRSSAELERHSAKVEVARSIRAEGIFTPTLCEQGENTNNTPLYQIGKWLSQQTR